METSAAGVRERIWVTKLDHSTDPPREVETVFIENGEVIEVTTPVEQKEESDGGQDGR